MKKTIIIILVLLFSSYAFSQNKGCISGDCDNGYGTWVYDNGEKYEGDWLNKKMNGNGTYYYNNGDIYKGQFNDNRLEGIGTCTFKNGAKYTGNWLNNTRDGEGTYFYTSGKVEKGLWINGEFAEKSNSKKTGCISGDCQNGFGTYIFDTGEKYIGNTVKSVRTGLGTYYFASGEWYNGEWKNNKRNGQGENYFADGEKYEGQWVDDKRHGFGTHYYIDGTEKSGMWENNRYVGTGTNNYGCISGDCDNGYGVFTWQTGEKYIGYWKNNKRNGQGKNLWANGEKYEGNWLNDKRNDYGIQIYPDKTTKIGFWKEDKYISANTDKSGCVSGNCSNGYGTYVFKNGNSYKGTFRNGKFEGQGSLTFVAGDKYSGEFRGGKFHGEGTMNIKGKGKYVGDFADGKYNGLGTYYYEDGRIQAGKWKENKFSGTAQSNLKVPQIEWISPTYASSEITKSEAQIKLCISSKELPQNIQVYVNDILQIDNAVNGLTSESNCDYTFTRIVKLKVGDNSIKVVVKNGAGQVSSKIKNIKYNSEQNKNNKRYALVIGNSSYQISPLENPTNDAKAMAEKLKQFGFDVMVYYNQTQEQMKKSIREFGNKITDNKGVGLFFFAGHGLQVNGENYLVPVDAHIAKYQDIELEAVNLNRITGEMAYARNDVNIIILDACRNNPFEGDEESGGKGLASAPAPSGSFLAFATAPGSVAADGTGSNGLYTQEILKAVSTPGWKIEDVFKEVRRNVYQLSGKQQTPWENSSIFDDFYFQK
ncbi:MAG: caspase family protein [Bacteroidales bacterium]|nr:caspase family protein [Bacteroidales bacterium]MBN2757573.1 caspase family protein [Bacteroidales bacterium]